MGKSRQIGITEEMKSKILNFDRQSQGVRKNLAYDCRRIISKELDDILWMLTNCPGSFRRYKSENKYTFPLEPVLPSDPKRITKTLDLLEEWIDTISLIKEAVEIWGLHYTRTGYY